LQDHSQLRVPRSPRRRDLVTAAAVALALGVSGCLSSGEDSSQAANASTASHGVQQQPTSTADAFRFLEQASFGPTEAAVDEVRRTGVAFALEEQFAKPATGYPSMTPVYVDTNTYCPEGDQSVCHRENFSAQPVQRQFFANAIGGADQLRQRVAFALSQILVVSMNDIGVAYGIRNYQQTLFDHTFGNYRDLLLAVTLSPVMGRYLDMVNNQKWGLTGVEPNENYARELLQLFSIGEYLLNPDGTRQLDTQGLPKPAYDQDTVESFARVFTGWTYAPREGQVAQFHGPANYAAPMIAFADRHDTDTKTLLLGRVLAPGQSPQKDLADAIDNIFNHPNVGPFIGTQLIQHLVTSNPSPQYVARVTAAFNNNSSGVRGDMKAVLRAILLDPEARGETKTDANYGKLREPVLFMTGIVRALGGRSDGVYLRTRAFSMGQPVFESPSVFNFYPPDYAAPGTDLLGPQFKIMHTGSILARANFASELLFSLNETVPSDTSVAGATGTATNTAPLKPLAADPTALVERLSAIMANGRLAAAEKQLVAQAVSSVSAQDATRRVRTAAYLIATSVPFQVTR
jgi:uncharacterized protein (DUF1800 family)